MSADLEQKVFEFINAFAPAGPNENILCAVSGGADSVALLTVLNKLQQQKKIEGKLVVAHVNHKLRGQSADADQAFTGELAQKMNLPFLHRTVDTRPYARAEKLSIETAARNLRIDALIDMARQSGCRFIATAHHLNDNAETVIHRLLRGTGFRGLAGIEPKRDFQQDITFIRPLLSVSRGQILAYCKVNNLNCRHDHTNDECTYTRNRIRHLLLPGLQKQSETDLADLLAKLSLKSRALYQRINSQIEKLSTDILFQPAPDRAALDKEIFLKQHPLVQLEFIRLAMKAVGSGEGKLTAYHYDKIARLTESPAGKKIELPNGFLAIAEREKIVFTKHHKMKTQSETPTQAVKLQVGKFTQFGTWTIETKILDAKDCDFEKFKANKDSLIEWFDYDKLIAPLIVRNRQQGDRFRPLGLNAEKRIGKFLTAAKADPELNSKLILFTDREKIFWAAPIRTSELAKITPDTKQILQIKIS
jgi:tRNA(Ile)-lysidine synthase